ncbi:hypothetical protein MTR67_051762 [Solanum verrucosum]|uniref:Uncharacterized protein n=1 Tax=Solanum verrucosum TaxID=315347 RepID=A0AAF0V5K9_SOLVR|nr:hypothetical protein MTR67_051762 [Solanum verrucosum]
MVSSLLVTLMWYLLWIVVWDAIHTLHKVWLGVT